MGSPVIFNGTRTKFLTQKGPLLQSGQTLDYDGELNYISNGSGSGAHGAIPSGWAGSDTVNGLGLSVTTTSSERPREFLASSAIKIVAKDGTQSVADYVYYDFTLDAVDLNRSLGISWAQKLFGAYAAGNLEVVIAAQSDRTTALHTPQTKNIPAIDGVFGTVFMSGSTAALSLVIRPTATDAMAAGVGISLSNVIVGPGRLIQGAAVGVETSYVPTFTSFGTVTTSAVLYKRSTSTMRVFGSFTTEHLVSAEARLSLPSGTSISAATPTTIVGKWWRGNSSATTVKNGTIAASGGNAYITFGRDDYTSTGASPVDNLNGTSICADHEALFFDFSVPIAEWSSSVYIAGADINSPARAGFLQAYAGATAPAGWMIADGSAISRATYAQLFANIGVTWGVGDNSTTFNLPDMRGVFAKGAGTTARAAGKDANGNYYAGTLGAYLQDKMQGHRHDLTTRSDIAGSGGSAVLNASNSAPNMSSSVPTSDTTNGTPRTGLTTEPQSASVTYIIKLYDDLQAPSVGFASAGPNKPGLIALQGSVSHVLAYYGHAKPVGDTAVKVRRFANVVITGNDFTDSSSDAYGTIITVNTSGLYAVNWSDRSSTGNDMAITVNSPVGTGSSGTDPSHTSSANIVASATQAASSYNSVSGVYYFTARDVIRCSTDGAATYMTTQEMVVFRIRRIY